MNEPRNPNGLPYRDEKTFEEAAEHCSRALDDIRRTPMRPTYIIREGNRSYASDVPPEEPPQLPRAKVPQPLVHPSETLPQPKANDDAGAFFGVLGAGILIFLFSKFFQLLGLL